MFVVWRPTKSLVTKPMTTTSDKLRTLARELAGQGLRPPPTGRTGACSPASRQSVDDPGGQHPT